MKLGAQMYTLRSFSQNERDLDITLGRVADIGYRTVQISGIGPIAPEKVRELCGAHGLEIVLTHTDSERILNDTERVIRDHDTMGCRYIGIGSMPQRYRMDGWFERFFADFEKPAKQIKQAGKLLMYHNHAFELERVGDKTMLECLSDGFAADELGFTLDTYWIQAGGGDVTEWIHRLKGRLPCVHLKDMAVVRGASVMSPVMEGNMNFRAILKALETSGTEHILVEQDECMESAFVCLEKSYRNITALGYGV